MATPTVSADWWPIQPPSIPIKRCRKCGENKPLDQFARRTGGLDLQAQCKACRSRHKRARYAKNATLRRIQAQRARKRSYGLSAAEFDAMLCEQAGRCKACDDPFGPGSHDAHVDHDHKTGRVRGLLCQGCNMAIGYAKDSGARLRLVAAYLEAENSE
jgi:hypothetical protein